MTVTETSIANSALVKVGAKRIINIDDGSPAANLCKEQLPKLADSVLRAHPWNCATKRIALGQLTTTPAFGYEYEFKLPTAGGEGHCLRVLELYPDEEFKIEGRKLLTDSNEASIRMIQRILYGAYDAMLAEGLAWRLAVDAAVPLTNSGKKQENMIRGYLEFIGECRSIDGQEGTPLEPIQGPWLTSRL